MFQIFLLDEAKAKGVTRGIYCNFIIHARSRKDGKLVSQKAAEQVKKVARA